MPQNSALDIVGLIIFLAAMIFSSEVAAALGPYIVIIVASAIGASFSLSKREKSSRRSAVFFFLRIAALAVLLTAALAAFVHRQYPSIDERLLLAPIAILIGWIGDGWPAVFRKIMSMVWGAVDLLRKGGGAS